MKRNDARHDTWFRALLRLLPSEFRGDFGRQMAEDFRDQRQDVVHRRGAFGLARLWLYTTVDLVWRAPYEHVDVFRRDASLTERPAWRVPWSKTSRDVTRRSAMRAAARRAENSQFLELLE
jgi:hypothetical protein